MGLKAFWQRWFGGVGERPVGEPDAARVILDPARHRQLEAILHYEFRDVSLLINALVHRSHLMGAGAERHGDSNERLEFLGDAVLGLVVNEYLYRRFPAANEGDLTKMKSLLVNGARLSEVAAKLGLGRHIQMSRAEAATGGRHRSSILADTSEALIGAVYLDGGLAEASRVIQLCFLDDCDELLADRGLDNDKSRLQELIQAQFKSPPRYRVVSAEGPDHARVFRVCVSFNGRELGYGEGLNKKTAEQFAARDALARIERDPSLLDDQRPDRGPSNPV